MTLHIIELASPATLAAARAALRQAQVHDRVLLVLADPADDLAHGVRLKLLRREADAAGVQVGLVTTDADVIYHAEQARIPVFPSTAVAQERWRYAPATLAVSTPDLVRPNVVHPPTEVGLGVKAPQMVRTRSGVTLLGEIRRRQPSFWLTAVGYAVALSFIVALFGLLLLFVAPQATVTLVPAPVRFVSSIELTGRVGIDAPDYLFRVTPARPIQARVEAFDTVETTGTDDAPVERAQGVVLLINQTNREIRASANTVVRTVTGTNIRFRLTADVVVPAGVGQQARVGIEAVEPGRQGNVPAFTIGEIEGSLNLSLRVNNPSPTGGGSVASVAVVTQADKDRLLGKMQASLQQLAYNELGGSLRQGEYIPPETVETFTLAETYDHFSGEPAQTLGLQLQLLARGLAIDLAGAQALVVRALREQVPTDHFLLEESIQIGQPSFARFDAEQVEFTLTASGDALTPIRAGEVRTLLAGAPADEAANILRGRLQLAKPPTIELTPAWLNRMPFIPTRISVRVLEE